MNIATKASRRALLAIAAAVVFTLASSALVGAIAASTWRQGEHQDAEFLIAVPPAWNGGLVMFAHGYEREGPGSGTVRSSPLDFHLAERGIAWAASGYRSKGYRPDWFLADTLALRERFIAEFGLPRWTVIHGQSMGGHVAIAALELHPEIYQGGLIECGVIDGVGLVDWLFAYTAAAEYFSGLPLLDTPRPAFETLANAEWPRLDGRARPLQPRPAGDSTAWSCIWPVATCRCGRKAWPRVGCRT